MSDTLIIVESPAKARTLGKYLGRDYTVMASMGHVRDLPRKGLSVDVGAGFVPTYEINEGKQAMVSQLKKAAKDADTVFLAADPDREGEAIAWHVAQLLKLKNPQRVVFHEITKAIVLQALGQPRAIDTNLVHAQEARRVIDRLVGYQVSPLIIRAKKGTSAGRVQSVAVRLVVDREEEISGFVPVESWRVTAELSSQAGEKFSAQLWALEGDQTALAPKEEEVSDPDSEEEEEGEKKEKTPKLVLAKEVEAKKIMDDLGVDFEGKPGPLTPEFEVISVTTKASPRNAPHPHTTSTLQQDASARLRLGPKKTMAIAQQLYEGMELGSAGAAGLITYMRTDSTRVSPEAAAAAAEFIEATFGASYVNIGGTKRAAKNTDTVQDAHEAIRPTDVKRTPESIKQFLSDEQNKVYELIWKRFVASQMAPCQQAQTSVVLRASKYLFRATGTVVIFDGFTKVWTTEKKKDAEADLPNLVQGENCPLHKLNRSQHFTKPKPRYTEATLIKALEEKGVGRPSTYAPTVELIQDRVYVEKDKERRLHPSELGTFVVTWMKRRFPDIVDIGFTAEMEVHLDEIESGRRAYRATLSEWYDPFAKRLAEVEKQMSAERNEGVSTGEICPECGEGELVTRTSQYGEYVICDNDECKHKPKGAGSRGLPTGEMCPKCGEPLVEKEARDGRMFVGCSGYPGCDYIPRPEVKLTGEDCPLCGKPLAEKTRRDGTGTFVGCTDYQNGCKYIKPEGAKLTGEMCPECGHPLAEKQRKDGSGSFVGCTNYKSDGTGCKYIKSDGKGPGTGNAKLTGEMCPDCGKPLAERPGRYGPFVGCTGYPNCKYIKPNLLKENCPECGKPLRKGKSAYGEFVGCSGYPKCRYIKPDNKKRK